MSISVKYGDGITEHGPGVQIDLSADEIAAAIDLYLSSQGCFIHGPRTIRYGGSLLHHNARVYVDPSGYVVKDSRIFFGKGPKETHVCSEWESWECGECATVMDVCVACGDPKDQKQVFLP